MKLTLGKSQILCLVNFSYFNLMLNMRKLTNDYLVWTEGSSQEVQFFDYIKFTPVAVKIMGLFYEINYRGVIIRATVVIWTDLKSTRAGERGL